MSYLKTIERLNLKSLDLLYFGFLRGWLEKDAIVDLAMSQIDEQTAKTKLGQIALNNAYDEIEFKTLVCEYLADIGKIFDAKMENIIREKWLLIFLEHLKASTNLDEKYRLNELQKIYAEFEYPEEMRSCSIYSDDNIDPIEAMEELIRNLKIKHFCS